MIADWQVFVVRKQRIVRAEQLADRSRMVNADIEVGVIADARRSMQGASHRRRWRLAAERQKTVERRPGRSLRRPIVVRK